MAIYKFHREKIGNIFHTIRVQISEHDVYCKVCEEYQDGEIGIGEDTTIHPSCGCDIGDFYDEDEYDAVIRDRDAAEIKAEDLEDDIRELTKEKNELEEMYMQEVDTLRANTELLQNTIDIEREEHKEAIELRNSIIDELEAKLRELEG